jgi:ankyrin repeat protein
LLPLTVYEQLAAGSLQKAAENGDAEEVTELVKEGADVNGTESWEDSALMSAAGAVRPNVITTLSEGDS